MKIRPRRNRKSATIRSMIEETNLSVKHLVYPLFLLESSNSSVAIPSMPNIFKMGLNNMLKEIEDCLELGINSFVIFPCVEEFHKDKIASKSFQEDFFYLKALKIIKEKFQEACIITDVAMDPYSSDGHDGVVDKNGKILNDETLSILGKMTLAQASTGVDIVAPSDMMDGRVGFIRNLLDKNGYTDVSIMSYTAKYASAFYGPFRDALDSAPKNGDKKSYQMNPSNCKEALIEGSLDIAEGADFIMVKPALSYLDIIKSYSDNFNIPIAAYNVSGEYAMLNSAFNSGWLERKPIIEEVLVSIRRAGASVILTYFAKEFATYHNS